MDPLLTRTNTKKPFSVYRSVLQEIFSALIILFFFLCRATETTCVMKTFLSLEACWKLRTGQASSSQRVKPEKWERLQPDPYFWLIVSARCHLLIQTLTLIVRKIRSGRQDSEEKRKYIYKDSNLSGLYLLTDTRRLWACLYNSNLIPRAQINTLITAVTWTTYQWWVIREWWVWID